VCLRISLQQGLVSGHPHPLPESGAAYWGLSTCGAAFPLGITLVPYGLSVPEGCSGLQKVVGLKMGLCTPGRF
jgi:hypothetical protein